MNIVGRTQSKTTLSRALNGLVLYTTWTVVASLVNLTHGLTFAREEGNLSQRDACLLALTLLTAFHTSWFIIESFVFDAYARYELLKI